MKRTVITSLAIFCSFLVHAQVTGAAWYTVGVTAAGGMYGGVNPGYESDSYTMFNRPVLRAEMILAGTTSMIIETSMLDFSGKVSGETDRTFKNVVDRTRLQWCFYKLKGKSESRTRCGMGFGINWRIFGIGDKMGFVAAGDVGPAYPGIMRSGPLTPKNKFGIGPSFHVVHQSGRRLTTRFSLFTDVEPGRILGLTAYPEIMTVLHYGRIGIMLTARYRYSYLTGNPNKAETFTTKKSVSVHTAFLSAGLAFDLERDNKRKKKN
jgi:hypothetical protein